MNTNKRVESSSGFRRIIIEEKYKMVEIRYVQKTDKVFWHQLDS